MIGRPVAIRNRQPGRSVGPLCISQSALLSTYMASDFVTMLGKRVDFHRRKTIEVRADGLYFRLNHRMLRRGVVGRIDNLGNRQKDKPFLPAETLTFQLTYTIPQDIRRPHRLADHSQRGIV